jgi:hypothetical protein
MSRTRRIVATLVAAAGLAALASPVVSADTLNVRTSMTVPAPYNAAALTKFDNRWEVYEGLGPVMVQIHQTITCTKGTVRRSGYPAMCMWSAALRGLGTNLTAQSDPNADAWIAPVDGLLAGQDFHAGYMRVGQAVTNNWNLVIRNDNIEESQELIEASVHAQDGGSVLKDLWIMDDEIRRAP